MPRVYQRREVIERFMEKVHIEPNSGCWLWGGGTFGDLKYGGFWIDGRTIGAHRVSWELHRGPVPDGLWVLHHCDNPPCVNPGHLYVGTTQDNTADRGRRGRSKGASPGERHHNAKMTYWFAESIRERVAAGVSQAAIARATGLSPAAVSMIVRRLRWSKPDDLDDASASAG